MLDTFPILVGSYGAMSAGMSVAMAKFSPNIGPRMRHLFAGGSPLAVLFAMELDGQESVALNHSDVLAAGGLFAVGVATSVIAGRILPRKSQDENQLHSD